jgi:hypothetical protein
MELEAPIQRKPQTRTVMSMRLMSKGVPWMSGSPMNQTTNAATIARPDQPAAMVPLSWLPVAFHTADSTRRPPSRGNPGRILNNPIRRLAHIRMLARVSGTPLSTPVEITAHIPAANTKLEAGPARATTTERPGEAVKLSNWVWPPQRLSTIFSDGQLKAFALSA